jgi:hypothetical protein
MLAPLATPESSLELKTAAPDISLAAPGISKQLLATPDSF